MEENIITLGDLLKILDVWQQNLSLFGGRDFRKIDLTVWHENRVRESLDVYRTEMGAWKFQECYGYGAEEYCKMRVVNVSSCDDFDFENNHEKTFKVWEIDVVTK